MVTKPEFKNDFKQVEPAKIVAGNAMATSLPKGADPTNRDKTKDNNFKLPEKVTQQEIKDNSFKYGGGRSSGNKSLIDNAMRRATEP